MSNKYMLFLIIGLILSKMYSYLVLPNKCNIEPKINPSFYPIMFKGMLMFPISEKKCCHVHHWIIYLFICICSLFIYVPKLIIGFSLGLLIQGMLYEDSFTFICDNPY